MTTQLELYQEIAKTSAQIWADTERPNYEADVWYNRNRNQISLAMLATPDGTMCKGKRVLSIGAREWVEREFLDALTDAAEIVRTDIVGEKATGILQVTSHRLPFADGSFGVVICRETLEHIAELAETINEIRRVLKAGGLFFVTTPNAYNMPPDGTLHVRGFTPGGFLVGLNRWGFRVLDKRGNVPNLFSEIGPLSQSGVYTPGPGVLTEFKAMAEGFEAWAGAYYFGTQMFVLTQKES